jgi:AraC-like DNA-binding protein
MSSVSTRDSLSSQFEAALEAAEAALSLGRPLVHAESRTRATGVSARDLRCDLARGAAERPNALAPRFERYLELIARRCGYVLDPMRAHLEAGLERVADALLAAGALDPKNAAEAVRSAERAGGEAVTAGELFSAYRRVVLEMVEAVQRPVEASRGRSLQRAVRFIHERFTDGDLTLARAARVAGLAPNYFCSRFREREGITFARYVRRLRVERAKQLLTTTTLSVDRVALLSGFSERHYFHRAFRQVVGSTPLAYRATGPSVTPTSAV